MHPFHIEILHTDAGRAQADQLRALIAADPLLAHASRPWPHAELPAAVDLYALLVVVTADITDANHHRPRITELEARGFPVLPVVDRVATYDFDRAPLPALSRRNALRLDDPDALLAALYHHGGLRRHGSGGHVMISYARVDGTDLAEALRLGLRDAGFQAFMDTHEVAGGAAIQADIKSAIDRADLILLIDSRGAAASPWVALEIDMARAAHVPVLAVTRTDEGYHALRAPHIPWPPDAPLAEVADAAVARARLHLARKHTFRARVARAIAHLAALRGWPLHDDPPEWLVHPHPAGVRVTCLDDQPQPGDVIRLRKRLGLARGLLIAGTRPFAPDDAQALRELGRDQIRVAPLGQVASALADRAADRALHRRRVFLSAAMPDQPESEAAAPTLAPFIITFVQTMVSLGVTVVFGGHPSITPMIHRALVEIAAEGSGAVELHQALLWRDQLPPEAQDRRVFGQIRWHGRGDTIADDLDALRAGMITPDLHAAVFVGGKILEAKGPRPGIDDEYHRFRAAAPHRPAFLLGLAAGAAARLIATSEPTNLDPLLARELAVTRDPDLATALIVAQLCDPPG